MSEWHICFCMCVCVLYIIWTYLETRQVSCSIEEEVGVEQDGKPTTKEEAAFIASTHEGD